MLNPQNSYDEQYDTASLGHNKPPLSKEDFIAGIHIFIASQEVAEVLSSTEFKALADGERLVALWRTCIEGMARYLRGNPRADATLAVYLAICVLSDNSLGFGDMAQERLGRFLGRGRQVINECYARLKSANLIDIEPVPGMPDRVSPVIPRILAGKAQSIWIFDALAPRIEYAKPGRKPKIHVAAMATPISSKTPVVEEMPVAAMATPNTKYVSPKNEIRVATAATQDSLEDSPVVETEEESRIRTRELTSMEEGRHATVAAVSANPMNASRAPELDLGISPAMPIPNADHLALWDEITARWGRPPNAEIKQAAPSFAVRQWLKNSIRALGKGFSAEMVATALDLTLDSMHAMVLDEPTEAAVPGAKPAKTYFDKTFAANLHRLRDLEHEARVNAEIRQTKAAISIAGAELANSKKLAALDHRIEQGHARASKAPPISRPDGIERFGDNEFEVAKIAGHKIGGFVANQLMLAARVATEDVRAAFRAVSPMFQTLYGDDPERVRVCDDAITAVALAWLRGTQIDLQKLSRHRREKGQPDSRFQARIRHLVAEGILTDAEAAILPHLPEAPERRTI